ncbi:MAG: HAD-IA family hydrolase [Acidimicrobiales bacterium]|nr:HAD-IA family hydrolase [Acidimicrobiales bacterium]MYG88214.1 HAD-IA family hydrolase [Acidimicrobiales bacterium]MYI26866.1 HAD-IA family hydrolase [Acidimicrobiales bacterium]
MSEGSPSTADPSPRAGGNSPSATATVDAVLFDFGGVITESPFEAFNRYEDRIGVPRDTIRQINATNPDTNAWARLERSEVSVDEFAELFEAEAADRGYEMSGAQVLACLSGGLRPRMVRALEVLAARLPVGCVTNNVRTGHGAGMSRDAGTAAAIAEVMKLFGVVIESSVVGLRKPDPRIYELACDRLGIDPARTAYLDDLGINCKPAAAMGMAAIKVTDPDEALRELEALVGFELR